MNIRFLTVGKIKESFFREALKEYQKRLGRYAKVEIIEVKEEKTPDKASEKMEEKIKDLEGERLLSLITDREFVVALDIEGRKLSSTDFSKELARWERESRGSVAFVIGGSLGLAEKVRERADYKLSFSDMTFPHQLMRVILAEQIYRAYRIAHNEPYHK